MKMKSLMAMAAMAFVFGLSSCGSNDEPPLPETPVANQVAGLYSGTETMTVDGDADESEEIFEITKVTDSTVELLLPEYGEGMMTIPEIPVKDIVLAEDGDIIAGSLKNGSYTGTVKNSKGEEKSFTVNEFILLYNTTNKAIIVTFTLKYGNMPFGFDVVFEGKRSVL